MNIFKFGGASVNNSDGVRNFVKIVQSYREDMIIVLSAMGKTTNALEDIVDAFVHKQEGIEAKVTSLFAYHTVIMNELFPKKEDPVFSKVESYFQELRAYLKKAPSLSYEFDYDQIVSIGEFLSTRIMSAYLSQIGFENTWLDARDLIRTDNSYRNAKVDWETTTTFIKTWICQFLHL